MDQAELPSTFIRTEVVDDSDSLPSINSKNIMKMPQSVNLVGLRESFLSDAPFVNKHNTSFWRRMLDSRNFQSVLSSTFHIVSECISDSGILDVDKLCKIEPSPALDLTSSNLAEMFYFYSAKEKVCMTEIRINHL